RLGRRPAPGGPCVRRVRRARARGADRAGRRRRFARQRPRVTLAVTGNTWVEVILILSAVVPLSIVAVLMWLFLRGAKNDPDEQRWRRLAQQRKDAERDAD